MKIITTTFCSFLFLLCLMMQSCEHFYLYSEKASQFHYVSLKSIGDTMTCCPDVALDMLINVSNTVDDSKLSKPDYYEYQILIAEALYKNDFIQTNDSAVFEAVNYYDSLAELYPNNVDVLFQKSRTHYYYAVGKIEKEEIKSACADYIIALKTIDEIKENNRNYNVDYFNGLIYNRLANIYYYNDAFNVARQLYLKANASFTKTNSPMPIAINYLCIAKMLSTMDLYNEEENYLNVADSLISNVLKIEDNQLKRKILMERALLASYRDNDNKKALELARQYMSKADGEEERVLGHTQLGEIFYKDRQYDSALYYFEKDFPRNHYTMLHCGNRIVEICKIVGDNEKAAYYAPFIAKETNQELELAPLKAELVAMYEQYEADKHKEEIRDLWLKIIMALTLVVIVIAIVFSIVSIIRQRRHIDEINRKDLYIRTLHGKIKKTNEENKIAKGNIKSFEEKLDLLNEAQKHEPVSYAESMQHIKNHDLCKKLMAVMQMNIKTTLQYPELALTEDEKLQIVEIFDNEFDGAIHAIINKYPRLKKSDEIVLCLSLLGFDNKHIAAVIGSSYHNVFVRSQKCLEILGGGEDLQDILVAMVSSVSPHQFSASRG